MITVDSLYVNGIVEGHFIARVNKVLASLLNHMWLTIARLELWMLSVRDHTGVAGHTMTDCGRRPVL